MKTNLTYDFETGEMIFFVFIKRKNKKVFSFDSSSNKDNDHFEIRVHKKYKNKFLDKLIYMGEQAKNLKELK